jgi:YfiH family protein
MITFGSLNDLGGIRHAFFTRDRGVSGGLFAFRNCGYGSGDDPDKVRENRARAMDELGLEAHALATVYQTHGAAVVTVEEPWGDDLPPDRRPRADGLVTRRQGIALGILTADCAPVLLADPEAGVIGAAHAGWRGAQAGILEATVAAMVELGARPAGILAAIGPCIAQRSYEVGPEFPEPFLAEDPGNADFFAPSWREGRFLFDLPGYAGRRLAALGLRDIASSHYDTLQDDARFFSYRRATLRGEPAYGRALSAIVLRD